MSNLEIAAQLQREFPLMWAAAMNADNRERLGLRVDQYDEEAARAMHELWLARTNSTALPSAE